MYRVAHDSPGIRMATPRLWMASCGLALHLLLGELVFVRQRLSSAWHNAGICLAVECGEVIGHCLNIRACSACCDGRCSLCRCNGQTLGLHVLRSSITGAPSLMLSLCCGSLQSVKEFGCSVGKQLAGRPLQCCPHTVSPRNMSRTPSFMLLTISFC